MCIALHLLHCQFWRLFIQLNWNSFDAMIQELTINVVVFITNLLVLKRVNDRVNISSIEKHIAMLVEAHQYHTRVVEMERKTSNVAVDGDKLLSLPASTFNNCVRLSEPN
ncbi:13306_t:CDS:2 [Ambispora leptoticha]|uniref:13306_t:CDS:1 n=1 Tax=Ambispora leptoticha TaxID=144679 RepID=A0A9N9FX09_9GLOM|nr:13306_t:CDS:2 [Ambispora leptoticha]